MNARPIAIALTALTLLAAALCAQESGQDVREQPLTFEAVAALATTEQQSLVALQRDLDATLERLGWQRYRDDVSLGLSGSVFGPTFGEFGYDGSADLGIALEVLPQLTVTGNLVGRVGTSADEKGPYAASAGVVFTPLADAQGRERDELTVARLESQITATARSLSLAAIRRLLSAVEAREQIPVLERALELSRRGLETTQALAARDGATREQVNAAVDAVRVARQQLESGRIGAERAVLELARAVGLDGEVIAVPAWDSLGLDELVDSIPTDDRPGADEAVTATQAVEDARIAVEASEVELAAARTFSPSLSVDAGVGLPGPGYSVGLSIAVSPAQWDRGARAEAEQDMRFAERSYEATVRGKELDLRIARLELDHAFENLEASLADLEIAESSLAENTFRFDRGYLTRLDVDRSQLNVERARLSVWTAKGAIATAWYRIDLALF